MEKTGISFTLTLGIVRFLVLVFFICCAFTTVASITVAIFFIQQPDNISHLTIQRSIIKGILFALLTLFFFILYTRMPCPSEEPVPLSAIRISPVIAGLFSILLFASLFTFPHLTKYPFPEPDEIHHLTVARNLAQYGHYASGSPQKGFIYFDPYDSVGPSVILPVALSFRMTGISLPAARRVSGVYFLLLIIAAYFLILPVEGNIAAFCGVFLMIGALDSIYLSRSLYGEVPGLFFIFCSLLSWRKGLCTHQYTSFFFLLLAGIFFGLALLSKMILLLFLWPLLGALLEDRFTKRRIRILHIMLPGIASSIVFLIWWGIQHALSPGTLSSTGAILPLYRSFLLFGLHPLPKTVGWLAQHPVSSILGIIVTLWAGGYLIKHRYSPEFITVILIIPFMVYWWCFFTTGSFHRYLWYAGALIGLFSGCFILQLMKSLKIKTFSTPRQIIYALLCIVLFIPPASRLYEQVERVYGSSETKDLYGLVSFVRTLPSDVNITTTWWPLVKSLDFFTNRPIYRYKEKDIEKEIIILGPHQRELSSELPYKIIYENPSYTVLRRTMEKKHS